MSGMPFLRAAKGEALALTGHLLLYPTGIRPERTPECGEGGTPTVTGAAHTDTPPVLLLHGFSDNRSTFVRLRRSLLGNGWPHVHCVNHSLLTRDIHEAAEHLGEQIAEVCRLTGHDRLDVVGHSLGGLIGRCHVQLHGGDAHVRTLVTLGTPHTGTYAAAALPPHPVARQMIPHSALLEELTESVPGGLRTEFVSIWGDQDLFVVPARNARLEHPDLSVTNVRVRGVGHLMLPVDSTVAAWIRDELARGNVGEGEAVHSAHPAPADRTHSNAPPSTGA